MAKNGFKALDSDMHVYDPPNLYLTYMDKKWGNRIPRGEWPKEHGRVEFYLGDGTVLRPRGERIEQGEKKVAKYHTEGPRRGYDPVSQVEAMDREGLDVAVLFRTSPLYADDNFEPEYAHALCQAWNSWIADFCKEDRAKLKPSAVIPMHDVDLAVKETRRAVKELGAIGLSIGPEPVRGRQLHDRYFDPLWTEAQELNVAVCFHPPASPGTNRRRSASRDILTTRYWSTHFAIRWSRCLPLAACAAAECWSASPGCEFLFSKATAAGCRGRFIGSTSVSSSPATWLIAHSS